VKFLEGTGARSIVSVMRRFWLDLDQ